MKKVIILLFLLEFGEKEFLGGGIRFWDWVCPRALKRKGLVKGGDSSGRPLNLLVFEGGSVLFAERKAWSGKSTRARYTWLP